MTLTQCAAVKPDGSQCRRVAREGSEYCHHHRHCESRSKDTRPFQQDLIDRYERTLLACMDCGRLILPGKSRLVPAERDDCVGVVCEPCHRLRRQIEARILEICRGPGGLPSERIYADLERFGVDRDLVEAARVRLHADGRLVSA